MEAGKGRVWQEGSLLRIECIASQGSNRIIVFANLSGGSEVNTSDGHRERLRELDPDGSSVEIGIRVICTA